MSLKYKLILSFIIPAAMLLIAGFWSSLQMRSLGTKVGAMLEENERSIQYAIQMNDAIERIDNSIFAKTKEREAEFSRIFYQQRIEFDKALKMAVLNITIPGEKEALDSLLMYAPKYFQMIERLDQAPDLELYRIEMFGIYEKIIHYISKIRKMNSDAMFAAAQQVIDRANRAALPGDLIILASVVFCLLFAWLTHLYIVAPIKKIYQAVKIWQNTGIFQKPEIKSADDLHALSNELEVLSIKFSPESKK